MQKKAKKPRMGRPPVPDADRRDQPMRVMMTTGEQAELERAAAVTGLPVSTWVRTIALAAARRGGA